MENDSPFANMSFMGLLKYELTRAAIACGLGIFGYGCVCLYQLLTAS